MRLAYQDLTVQEKKREKELKHMDPKKKEQAERLGMGGFGAQRCVSVHIALYIKCNVFCCYLYQFCFLSAVNCDESRRRLGKGQNFPRCKLVFPRCKLV